MVGNAAIARVTAVAVVVLSLRGLAGYVGPVAIRELGWVPLLFAFVFPVFIAAWLWVMPNAIAPPQSTDSDRPPEDIFGVGLALIGVVAVVFGLLDLTFYLLSYLFMAQTVAGLAYADPSLQSENLVGLGLAVVQVGVGGCLIVGWRRLAKWLHAVRYGDSSKVARDDT